MVSPHFLQQSDHSQISLTEEELKKDFLHHFQQYKVFKQKAFYFDEGATMYYKTEERDPERMEMLADYYYQFLKENYFKNLSPGSTVAFVSLGCGNAWKEKLILQTMMDEGYDVQFVGIDSSPTMVEIAKKELADVGFKKEFVCSDFASEDFIQKFTEQVKDFDVRIYSFLGGTLGNVEQDYIADILFDMLETGDALLFEVVVREENSDKEDRLLFERYLGYLDVKDEQDFFFKPLKDIGVPFENGELFLVMEKELALNALRFIFSYRFSKKTVITYHERTTTLLPNSTVSLMTIRAYDPKGLINFFEERNFTFLAKHSKKKEGIFLFKK